MKVIFLDVDGVLNCASRWGQLPLAGKLQGSQIDPEAVVRLKRLVDATDARIVVSSTWRHYYFTELTRFLTKHGIPGETIINVTPDLAQTVGELWVPVIRGDEIAAWLAEHPEVVSFVILDDDCDMGPLSDRLVQTTWQDGLQDEHVERAIAMLGTPKLSPDS